MSCNQTVIFQSSYVSESSGNAMFNAETDEVWVLLFQLTGDNDVTLNSVNIDTGSITSVTQLGDLYEDYPAGIYALNIDSD